MRISDSWTVAMKDLSIFQRKKYILYSLIALPLILSLLLPSSILLSTSGVPKAELNQVIDKLLRPEFTIFIIMAAILPSVIGSYSFIGEKVEKSLEPLLATPATDSELLLGKSLAAFLPSLGATYVGALIFMIFTDALTYGRLHYLVLPDLSAVVVLILAIPFSCIMSVEFSVIISSRVNDIRAAQQLGSLIILPLLAIFILSQAGVFSNDVYDLLLVSGILLVADVALSFLSRATFQREEILTKWK